MGYSEHTNYILSAGIAEVARELIRLFREEGMEVIQRPSYRELCWYEPMRYNSAMENNIWGVMLCNGNDGCIIIKTAPPELLSERSTGSSVMRFIILCMRLRVPGIQFHLYDSCQVILVETDGTDRYNISGFGAGDLINPDPLRFYGELLHQDRIEVRFDILPFQNIIDSCKFRDFAGEPQVNGDMLAASLAKKFAGFNSEVCGGDIINMLVSHSSELPNGCLDLYFEWPSKDRPEPPRHTLSEHVILLNSV